MLDSNNIRKLLRNEQLFLFDAIRTPGQAISFGSIVYLHAMTANELWQQFLTNIRETKWQEWVSTVTQVASVIFARKNNILVYPTGIVGVLLAAYVYMFQAHPPLYADAGLNVYYFLMSVYGWYHWAKRKDGNRLAYPITWCRTNELVAGVLMCVIFWGAITYVLVRFTDSNTPIMDALVSSSAVTAMWWMAKRKIENWLAWIFSNIVAIPLNFYKGLMLFTLMYILFLALAYMGYQTWKKNQEASRI